MQQVLIIDDNQAICDALDTLLSVYNIAAIVADSPAAGLRALALNTVDLVIQDMNFSEDTTSGREGEALFADIRRNYPDIPIILLTAWTQLETAVELVRAGAADYVAKPWDDEKLMVTVRNLLELSETQRVNQHLLREQRRARERLAKEYDLCGLIYQSDGMHHLVGMATRIAKADLPVLITGPNGSGKEKIAEIVQANSLCSRGPFVKVNVGALPADLIESELFGAEAGAYTGIKSTRLGRFEAANHGTLFLDEIGNLSLDGQAKLLRVIQTGEFERLGSSETRKTQVRIISATNTDLRQAVVENRFREDLYYRLNVIELAVPPLNERQADILALAEHFLRGSHRLSRAAEDALLKYPFPGNVRELENCMQRASLLAHSEQITVADLNLPEANVCPPAGSSEEEWVRRALQEARGVVAVAARSLGLSRQALYRRMEKYGIDK